MNANLKGYISEKDPSCPACKSQDLWKHGKNGAGKRQWLCRSCRRVFVVDPYLSSDIRLIADRMIEEGISVPKIAGVLKGFVSRRWLYNRKGLLNV